jgi:hypothetical protein
MGRVAAIPKDDFRDLCFHSSRSFGRAPSVYINDDIRQIGGCGRPVFRKLVSQKEWRSFHPTGISRSSRRYLFDVNPGGSHFSDGGACRQPIAPASHANAPHAAHHQSTCNSARVHDLDAERAFDHTSLLRLMGVAQSVDAVTRSFHAVCHSSLIRDTNFVTSPTDRYMVLSSSRSGACSVAFNGSKLSSSCIRWTAVCSDAVPGAQIMNRRGCKFTRRTDRRRVRAHVGAESQFVPSTAS